MEEKLMSLIAAMNPGCVGEGWANKSFAALRAVGPAPVLRRAALRRYVRNRTMGLTPSLTPSAIRVYIFPERSVAVRWRPWLLSRALGMAGFSPRPPCPPARPLRPPEPSPDMQNRRCSEAPTKFGDGRIFGYRDTGTSKGGRPAVPMHQQDSRPAPNCHRIDARLHFVLRPTSY